jgi:hypothetical protein
VIAAASATLADASFDPAHRHVPLCPFKALTGWLCPLCGGLRSTNAIARQHWAMAWHANPLFIVSLPLIALYWLDWRRRGAARRLPAAVVIGILLVMVAFAVARNLASMSSLRP